MSRFKSHHKNRAEEEKPAHEALKRRAAEKELAAIRTTASGRKYESALCFPSIWKCDPSFFWKTPILIDTEAFEEESGSE